jgi:hypothetical protein
MITAMPVTQFVRDETTTGDGQDEMPLEFPAECITVSENRPRAMGDDASGLRMEALALAPVEDS